MDTFVKSGSLAGPFLFFCSFSVIWLIVAMETWLMVNLSQTFKIKSQDEEYCSNTLCHKSPFISPRKGQRRRKLYSKKRAEAFPHFALPPLYSFGNINLSSNIGAILSTQKLGPSFTWLPHSKFRVDPSPWLTTSTVTEDVKLHLWAWTCSHLLTVG